MNARLEWTDEKGESRVIQVVDRVFIGRTCRGAPEDKKVIIAQSVVSGDHAVLTFTGQQMTICDTSRNGTLLNGVRLTPGVERAIHDGETFTIGDCTFKASLEGETTSFETMISAEKTTTVNLKPVVTHLVGDVRGYSTVSQQLSSTAIYEVMKEIFGEMSRIVHRRQGVVKDFAGDAIFAIWEHGDSAKPETAVAACRAAIDQLHALPGILANLPDKYKELRALRMGWGITTGTVTFSNYGVGKGSMAVVGDSTNLAFRLSDLANKTLASSIVLCGRTAELVKGKLAVHELGGVDTKGREGKEVVFGLETEDS